MTQAPKKEKIILGITGELLSGKSTAAEFYIQQYGAKMYKFSRLMDQVLIMLNLPVTRINEQDIAMVIKRLYGDKVWANALAANALQSNHSFVLFDGLRKFEDLAALKENLPGFCLVYIDAPIELRYQRALERHEKPGENLLTLEEFQASQTHEADVDIPKLRAVADHVIANTGTLEEFHAQLAKIATGELLT